MRYRINFTETLSDFIHFFRKSNDILWLVLLAAWYLVFYFPVTLGQEVFADEDFYWIHLPVRAELAQALKAGSLPLWTPYLQAGFPLLAEGQVGALYPVNILFHLLLPDSTALSYTILFALIWSSVGMYLLIRACGFSAATAWLAGFVFGVNGVMIARVTHADVLSVACWLPWLILFQQRYWNARFEHKSSTIWFLLTCFAIALQFLGGSPQRSLHNISTFALFGFFAPFLWGHSKFAAHTKRLRYWWSVLSRTCAVTLLMIVIGAALAAIQLLPTFELLGFSTRGTDLSLDFINSYSLDPAALTQFLVPFGVLGEPTGTNLEYWAYFGALPLILMLLGIWVRRDFRSWFLAIFGLGALFLAIGNESPLYQLLYYVPLFNRFRVPARFLFLFIFAATFLIAIAFEELSTRLNNRGQDHRLPQILVGGFGLAFLGVTSVAFTQPVEFWLTIWQVLPIVLFLGGLGLIFVAYSRRMSRSVWVVLVIGWTVLDLTLYAATFLTNLDRTTNPAELTQIPRPVQAMDTSTSIYRVYTGRFPTVTRAAAQATLWASLPLLFDKEGVDAGYNPLSLSIERNEEYIHTASPMMIDLMNIRYYLLSLEPVPPSLDLPLNGSEPMGGLTLDLLAQQPSIPPMHLAELRVTSYTDHTNDKEDGLIVGEIILGLSDGQTQTLPIRLGIETEDWAIDATAQSQHHKPASTIDFPAYLNSVGHNFEGHRYVARFPLTDGSSSVVSVGAKSFLPGTGLTIEKIDLIDQSGQDVSLAQQWHRNEMSLAFRSQNAVMWENQSYLPRAFMVHSAQMVDDTTAFTQMQSPQFTPDQIVLLSDTSTVDPLLDSVPGKSNDQVEIIQRESEYITLKVNATADGYLVMTDSWYPGWQAKLDGAPVPIYRADVIFRAVRVPPGEHQITFEYRPLSFTLGEVISGFTLVLLIGWMLIGLGVRGHHFVG